MKKIGYYLVLFVIWIFSFIPFRLLYIFSDFLSLVFYYLIPYRKTLIIKNLALCFPDKSEVEIKNICKDFYKNLSDILLESIKGFSMKGEEIYKRYVISSNEDVDRMYKEGKSFIATSAHLANWEWGVPSTGLYFKHMVLGVYKRLNHPDIDKYMRRSRARYNVTLSEMKETSRRLRTNHNLDPFVLVLIADQSPSNPKKAYWTNFLGRETAFFFGVEKFAKEFNYPVYYFNIVREKRGFYKVNVELVCKDPSQVDEGEIIRIYASKLEQEIKRNPANWLWSHNRWKHERPANMTNQV